MIKNSISLIEGSVQRSNLLVVAVPFILFIVLLSGCATYKFKNKQYEYQGEPNRKVVWSYFWSIPKVPTVEIDSDYCQCWPVGEVVVRRDAFQSILTFATLGMVSPATIEWKCVVPRPKADTVRDPLPLYCDTSGLGTAMEIKCYGIVCDTINENRCLDSLPISCDTVRIRNYDKN